MPIPRDASPLVTGAVVALKRLDLAKSRLDAAAPALRERLAVAMLRDTCAALSAVVDRTLVVTPVSGMRGLLRSTGADVMADPGLGLNGAYAAGADALATAGVRRVIAVVADLPALRPDDVGAVLERAGGDPGRAYVADHTGTGTTMLVAVDQALDPLFEQGSAHRHRESGASDLHPVVDRARVDVDSLADLARAAELGLGTHTARLWDGDRPAHHTTGVVASTDPTGWTVVCADGTRRHAPSQLVTGDLATLHPTQRVHLALGGSGATDLWI